MHSVHKVISEERIHFFKSLILIFYLLTHTIRVDTPVVYTDLTEVIPQLSAARDLPPGRPISMWAVEEDVWLAAWQRGPQPPRSLWRPPFTSNRTIFMQERDLPSENKPRLKRKQSALPNKFQLICQGRRGRRGAPRVMDACPSSC